MEETICAGIGTAMESPAMETAAEIPIEAIPGKLSNVQGAQNHLVGA
jgi:hypothetical protein